MSEITPKRRIDPLLNAANDAAKHTQNIYLTFLLLSTYIAIIIFSTTDEQLLKVSAVTLPLLNIALPIVAFYTFIPWLFLLLHFNLLLQLYLLANKLHVLEAAVVADNPDIGWEDQHTAKLFPFPFSHMLIGRYQTRVRILLTIVVVMTILLLPPAILTMMQVRFLPYHDAAITWNQRIAVLVDLILLWVYWPMIIVPGTLKSQDKRRKKSQKGDCKKKWKKYWQKFYSRRIIRFLGKRYWQRMRSRWRGAHNLLVLITVTYFLFSVAVAVLPGEEKIWPFRHLTTIIFDDLGTGFLHRNLRLSGKTLVLGELPVEIAAGLRSQDEKIKADAMRRVAPLTLTNRDLRSADLRDAILPKVDLRGANLDNARIENANLWGADLRPFDIKDGGRCIQRSQEESLSPDDQNSAGLIDINILTERGSKGRFCSSSLRRANLSGVSLENARLPYAQLQEATLRRAVLPNTKLGKARLEGADLWDAKLRDADLSNARLQGAYLGNAQLQGADLSGAQLQGMGSMDTQFQGALLEHAQLQGASLMQARLQGASLRGALLQGATLEGAQLQGATLEGAELQGANLHQAQLQGAYMEGARIGGANFQFADLSLSDLRDVDREPLAKDALRRLVEEITKVVNNESRRKEALIRLSMFAGRLDTLGTAQRAEDILCNGPLPFKNCISVKDIEEYDKKIVPFLAELGCSDPYVANGMNYRAVFPDDSMRSFNPELARMLLDPKCAGAKELPERNKAVLRQIIEARKGIKK